MAPPSRNHSKTQLFMWLRLKIFWIIGTSLIGVSSRVIHSYVVNDKLDILLLFWPDSESFGKWCLEKCKNFFDTTTLMPAKSVTKFYYITHLCEIGLTRKFNFFKVFIKRPCIFFSIINFTSKICSFEVHYVDLAQKITEWEGDDYCKFC